MICGDEAMAASDRPVHEIRLGRVRAAIWRRTGGQQEAWFTVTISRSYRVDGIWKDTDSFGRDDLPVVAKAADMAYAWIWQFTRPERDHHESR